MNTAKTKFRTCFLFLIIGAIVFGIWYYLVYVNDSNSITEGTFVEELNHMKYCMKDAGKTLYGCMERGLKSL